MGHKRKFTYFGKSPQQCVPRKINRRRAIVKKDPERIFTVHIDWPFQAHKGELRRVGKKISNNSNANYSCKSIIVSRIGESEGGFKRAKKLALLLHRHTGFSVQVVPHDMRERYRAKSCFCMHTDFHKAKETEILLESGVPVLKYMDDVVKRSISHAEG
jgi:hypothetical protein